MRGRKPELLPQIIRPVYGRSVAEAVEVLEQGARAADNGKQTGELMEPALYLEENREDVRRFRRYIRESDAETRKLLVTGTGAIEKKIDALVVSRFKKRVMKWSRRGAANLLALRTLKMNRKDLDTSGIRTDSCRL